MVQYQLSRSQKEVIALGASLANNCPHCAFIHTAMGAWFSVCVFCATTG